MLCNQKPPLDEADGLLRLKKVPKLEISDIAQRLAKDARFVARRLALTDLIEEARDDFRNNSITLAHVRASGEQWMR